MEEWGRIRRWRSSRRRVVGWRNWVEGGRMEEQGRVVGRSNSGGLYDGGVGEGCRFVSSRFRKNPHYRSFSSLC
jgi:hypothetical protein